LPFLRTPAEGVFNILAGIRNFYKNQHSKVDLTFFTPTFWRTGSEIVLWNLILRLPGTIKVRLLSRYKSDPTLILPQEISTGFFYGSTSGTLLSRAVKAVRHLFIVSQYYYFNRATLWYINTVALPDVVRNGI
jgi:hypothetical protein